MMNYVKLGNICEIARGGSPRPINDYLTNDNNGINWIKIGDTSSDSKYIEHTEQKIKPEGVKKSRYVKVGDFILSNSMSFGRPYILKIDGCIHDGWLVLQNIDSKLDKDYLYTVLSSPYAYHQFEKMAVGGVVNNLNSDKVKELIIPLPSLEKQKRIAKVLEECNSIIIKHKKLLEKYDTLIKSRFIEMFGDNPTENGKWNIEKLEDVCTVTSSKRIYAEEQSTSGVPFLRISDLVSRINGNPINDLFIPNSKFKEFQTKGLVPSVDDILITSRGTLGLCYIIKPEDKFYFQDGMITWLAFENHNKVLSVFIYWLFKSVLKTKIDNETNGATVKYVSISDLKKLQIPVPQIELQNDFVAFVQQIDKSKFEIWLTLKNYGIIGKRVFLYDQF